VVTLPPGTLLQLMYLEERLRRLQPGRFVEIGPGSGEITDLLLRLGWSGASVDLEPATVDALAARFAAPVGTGRLHALSGDFLQGVVTPAGQADLVISCMVMEHLDDAAELRFMQQAARSLKPGGRMVGLVPGSPAHWGIEDDIAGHCRRYTREALASLAQRSGWTLGKVAGLTVPVSNLLLPVSDFLVRRAEASRIRLSPLERTRLSGRRNVRFKTHFPSLFGLLLNRATMAPLHWLQKRLADSPAALVIYFEAVPPARTETP